MSEQSGNLDQQIKTALADAERANERLYRDVRISSEAANTPCGPVRAAMTSGTTISIDFDNPAEAERAYDAIERLLGDMGQIGTLSMCARQRDDG